MTRANRCGHVIRPNASVATALRTNAGSSPSAPPIANTTSGTPSSRHSPMRRASSMLVQSRPRSSSATRVASFPTASNSKRPSSALASSGGRGRFSSTSRTVNGQVSRAAYSSNKARLGASRSRPTATILNRTELRQKFGLRLDDAERISGQGQIRRLQPPHLLDGVEGTDLGPEEMDHDIAAIEQHPIALRKPFHPDREAQVRTDLVDDMRGHRANLARGTPAGDDENVLGLVGIERSYDRILERLGRGAGDRLTPAGAWALRRFPDGCGYRIPL